MALLLVSNVSGRRFLSASTTGNCAVATGFCFVDHGDPWVLYTYYQYPPTCGLALPLQNGYQYQPYYQREQHNKNDTERVYIRWRKPPPGYLKLNSDGSSLGNPGLSSYGGLIRDEFGNWVFGYAERIIGNTTSVFAEVLGIFKGLCLVREKGLTKVIIETDCQVALHLITVDSIDRSHPLKAILDSCKLLMRNFGCYIIHTKREGNHCADQIAKLGGKRVQEYSHLENPPVMLIPFLLAN